jgi:hypothetical protein
MPPDFQKGCLPPSKDNAYEEDCLLQEGEVRVGLSTFVPCSPDWLIPRSKGSLPDAISPFIQNFLR